MIFNLNISIPCPWVNDWNLFREIVMIKKVLISVSKQRMKNKKRFFCMWLNAEMSVLHTTHIGPLDILKHLLAFWSPLFSIHSVWHVRGQVELCLCIYLFIYLCNCPSMYCLHVCGLWAKIQYRKQWNKSTPVLWLIQKCKNTVSRKQVNNRKHKSQRVRSKTQQEMRLT